MADEENVLDIMTDDKPDPVFKVGDAVMLDDNRCKIIAFGTRTGAAIVRVTVPGNKTGRRLAVAVVPVESLKKVGS